MKQKLLITFLKWYIRQYHDAVLPTIIMEEIVDNFLTHNSCHQMRQN